MLIARTRLGLGGSARKRKKNDNKKQRTVRNGLKNGTEIFHRPTRWDDGKLNAIRLQFGMSDKFENKYKR